MSNPALSTLVILALSLVSAGGCAPSRPSRLAVVLVVDQMCPEHLMRFADQYRGGLARLLDRGAVYTDSRYDHAVTVTAAGHATIATGTVPARHGVVLNSEWDRARWEPVYCVEDIEAGVLGEPEAPGRSPRRLLRETVGDWLKRASPSSKVVSLSAKDRSAVLMGGHTADDVYWYRDISGRFRTSTYYRDRYPGWVAAFNASGRVAELISEPWLPLLGESEYSASREDDFTPEGFGVAATFPHRADTPPVAEMTAARALLFTPAADRMVLDLGRDALVHHDLGKDGGPDLLWLGLSATDYIGHVYGPFSRETHDQYLRLDRMLGEFFDLLDQQVGSDGYAVLLTSDHGVQPMAEELLRRNRPGRRLQIAELEAVVAAAVAEIRGELGIEAEVPSVVRPGVYLGGTLDRETRVRLRHALADVMRRTEGILDAFTWDELADPATEGRPFLQAFRRSFHEDRSPDLMLLFEEGTTVDWTHPMAHHGSPHPADLHVPLIVMGAGIRGGRFDRPTHPADVAPTLARILGIDAPDDLDGKPLEEIF